MAHSISRATLGLTQPAQIEPPKISFTAKEIDVVEWKGDILAVGVTEKDMVKDDNSKFKNPILQKLDSRVGLGSKRVGLIGLGQSASTAINFKSLGESVAAAAKASQASNVAVVLASSEGISNESKLMAATDSPRLLKSIAVEADWPSGLSNESKLTAATALSSGIVLGTHEDARYKSESKISVLKSVDIIGLGTGPELEKKLKYAEDVSVAVILGRELVNSLANVPTPVALTEEASKIASMHSYVLSATILDEEKCKDLKMGSYLGVAAASANPPRFIHLCYKPPGGSAKVKLALVGKGLTFESGGNNVKTGPGCSIGTMKCDMGGSAAVLGAAKAIGQIKPPGVEIHFVIAAWENMISGAGMRPGDIITASNGKTIEVNNTDAEGRLTLADALVYTCNLGVEKIIDLATLTGACVVALGPAVAGVFTPSDRIGEGGVADMLNTSVNRTAGAIAAALFLKQVLKFGNLLPVIFAIVRFPLRFGITTLVEWVLKNSS
ncbi:hypothetical protein Patl1_14622 [Pistacia atlantica]|uniref:Uncharacterized protein n=1 Tax=Pistacia atlantica TaxID=434234 RepID=A0ACC1ASY7_9ROSI|nr:hypothetical protein Patl1_14622 [Pistacia atlantica]